MGLDMYLKARRAHYVSRFDGSDFDKPSEFSEASGAGQPFKNI